MAVIEKTAQADVQKAIDCPSWCSTNHAATYQAIEEKRYRIRCHYGSERKLTMYDEFGGDATASVALSQVDYQDDSTRGPVAVTAICEGVMTPEQAEQYIALVQAAAAEARTLNADTTQGAIR